MNIIDRIIAAIAPTAGLRRAHARRVLASYDAATPSRLRNFHRDRKSPDQLVYQSAAALRAQARNLERNHDIARGILRTLTNNIVGPHGIGIEPQPRRADGTIHEEYAAALRAAWRDWVRKPEVTHRHSWAKCQRLMVRAWLRDGESFAQELLGAVPKLDHGTRVPYSLELFEADMVPIDYNDVSKNIVHGVARNGWGRPTKYHVYRRHPAEGMVMPVQSDLREIPATRMLHLAILDRIGQTRGVSEFASVITRLEDIKDYEESERIAAKIAAALTAYVKKGSTESYEAPQPGPDGQMPGARELNIAPGMIIDGLGVGEEIGLIDSKRPNPNLITFRQGQLRATAAGVGASYSSIARDYNGTFSAQRQELVEQSIHYAVLTDEAVGQVIQPVWETFVFIADASGVVRRPADVDAASADDALYIGQAMPWIDPLKEALGWKELVQAGFASEVEVLRKRGVNPRDVLEQIKSWRKSTDDAGLQFSSNAAHDKAAAPVAAPPQPDDDDE
jgi:lambda family phage portal protein